jgi:restriction system protein
MTRRRTRTLDAIFAIAAAVPWWVSVLLAVSSVFLLRLIADGPLPAVAGPRDTSSLALERYVFAFARIGQFVLPVLFMICAILAFARRRTAVRVVGRFAGAAVAKVVPPEDVPDAGPAPAELTSLREVEALVGEVYGRQGYSVAEKGSGASGGVDLVLVRGKERFLVQCKHWRARMVDVKVVRQLKGAVVAAQAAGGAVVTTGQFTLAALECARTAGVDLIDGAGLEHMVQELAANGNAAAADPAGVSDEAILAESPPCLHCCPQCGSSMVRRTAKRGTKAEKDFWGCQRYPSCRGTISAPALRRTG